MKQAFNINMEHERLQSVTGLNSQGSRLKHKIGYGQLSKGQSSTTQVTDKADKDTIMEP